MQTLELPWVLQGYQKVELNTMPPGSDAFQQLTVLTMILSTYGSIPFRQLFSNIPTQNLVFARTCPFESGLGHFSSEVSYYLSASYIRLDIGRLCDVSTWNISRHFSIRSSPAGPGPKQMSNS